MASSLSGVIFEPTAVNSFVDFLQKNVIRDAPNETPKEANRRSSWRRTFQQIFRCVSGRPSTGPSSPVQSLSSGQASRRGPLTHLNPNRRRLMLPWVRRFAGDSAVLVFSGKPGEDVCLWTRRTVRLAMAEEWSPSNMINKAVKLTYGRALDWANNYQKQHPEDGYEAFWEFIRSIVIDFSSTTSRISASVSDRWFSDWQRPDQDPLDFVVKMIAVGRLVTPAVHERQCIRHIVDRMQPEMQDLLIPSYLSNLDMLMKNISENTN